MTTPKLTARERLEQCGVWNSVVYDLAKIIEAAMISHAWQYVEEAARELEQWANNLRAVDKLAGTWHPAWEGQVIETLNTAVQIVRDVKVE